MALNSGTKFGPYEILAPLGAGGMGEVYRARDTRLGREVAVKVLPQHLSGNPDLKARFEREAKAVSSLSHPHICALYDIGSQEGTDYLVMELLEGESLADRLQKGALPLKQALERGIEIAEALEKAHKQGIVHRDLKPGNIMLTKSGAKLLDFGLAKPNPAAIGAFGSSSSGSLTPSTPTMSVAALSAPADGITRQGTVVGTYQYMAPEVLQGQEADARSDIFSFGCVLYEMLTARRAFSGRSQLSVLTAILEHDPEPLSAVQPLAPPALEHVVQSCLAKSTEDRLQTAHDVRLQLSWISAAAAQPLPRAEARWREKALAAFAAVLAIAVIALVWNGWRTTLLSSSSILRLNILPPEGTRFAPLYRNGSPALSPDGTRVVFVVNREGKTSLWLRGLDKLEATELHGTEGGYFPFWSPDGSSIGFLGQGKLWRMELNGGSPVAICDAAEVRGASWGQDNTIILSIASFSGSPVMRVSVEGGTPEPVTRTPRSLFYLSDRWPFFLPDGKHFLYLHAPNGDTNEANEIHFASLDGKTDRILLKGAYTVPQYASGRLLVGRNNILWAQRFDPVSGDLSGSPVQVAGQLLSDDLVGSSIFSVSQNGTLLYVRGTEVGGEYHAWVDAAGKLLAETSDPDRSYGALRFSPDEMKVATTVTTAHGQNVWIWDLTHGTRAQISDTGQTGDAPVWSPDGRLLYYSYGSAGNKAQIYSRPADGTRPQELLFQTAGDTLPVDITADDRLLLYEEQTFGSLTAQLKALPLTGDRKPVVILESVQSASNAALRPGANDWLAYEASDSGRPEVYVTRFPHPGVRYQVSATGGAQAVWGRDGKRLYFLDEGQKMTVVDVQANGDSIQISKPVTLFPTALRSTVAEAGYGATRDGRFLILNSVTETSAPITVITNWTAGLKN